MNSEIELVYACESDIGKEGAFFVLGAACEESPNLPEGAEKLYSRSAARCLCMNLQVYDYEPTG